MQKLLFLAMLLCTTVAYGQTEETYVDTSGDYECVFNDDGITLKIVSYKGTATEVTVPQELTIIPTGGENETYSVTTLGDQVFNNNKIVTKIVVGDHILSIDKNDNQTPYHGTFYGCSNLTDITLPSGLTVINNHMFQNCKALTEIVLPDNIEEIGNYAFESCEKLSQITRGNNIKIINHQAFAYCKALKSFEITSGIKSLGHSSFAYSGLTEIIIPNTLESVDRTVFYDCRSLTKVEFKDDFCYSYIPDGMFAECTNLVDVKLANNITELGTVAFAKCSKLDPHSIMNQGIKVIGESAFSGNKTLVNLVIPDAVTFVGNTAFGECNKLETVKLGKNTVLGEGVFLQQQTSSTNISSIDIGDNENYTLVDGVLFDKEMTTLVLYPAKLDNSNHKYMYKVPASVTKIAPCAFKNVENLRSIALPTGLEEIGWLGLDFLWETMTIPAKVTKIGNVAFSSKRGNERPIFFMSTTLPKSYYKNLTVVYLTNGTLSDVERQNISPNNENISIYVKPSAYESFNSKKLTAAGVGAFNSLSTDIPLGTVPSSGWKSIARDFDVDLSGTGITAYIVTSISENGKDAYMQETQVEGKEEGKYIPARTGKETFNGVEYDKYTGALLYISPEATNLTYRIGEDEDAVLTQETNYLFPAVVDTYTERTETHDGIVYYNLALNGGKFKQYSDDGITGYNKTILSVPGTMLGHDAGGAARTLSLSIVDNGETTGISQSIATSSADDLSPWFTIYGQRVCGRPHSKGIYIHNGSKVVIK